MEISELERHEKECLIRYTNIEQRLERGGERMNRIEKSVYALYPFMVGLIFAANYLR